MQEKTYRDFHVRSVSESVFGLAERLKNYRVSVACAVPGRLRYRPIEAANESLKEDQCLWICGHDVPKVVTEITHRFSYTVFQGDAQHSMDQARWICSQLESQSCPALSLYVARFHLVRHYLTVVEALRRRQLDVVVVPVPVDDQQEDEHWLGPTEKHISHEARVIVDYSMPKADGSIGDVATPAYFFTRYLPWLNTKV